MNKAKGGEVALGGFGCEDGQGRSRNVEVGSSISDWFSKTANAACHRMPVG